MRRLFVILLLLVAIISGSIVLSRILSKKKAVSNGNGTKTSETITGDDTGSRQDSDKIPGIFDTSTSEGIKKSSDQAVATDKVSISGNKFTPSIIKVKVGTEIIWMNYDSTPHKVVEENNGFSTLLLRKGGESGITLNQKGVYSYHDSENPDMKGTIIVE